MIVIAHAGHYALEMLQFAPLLIVVAFAIWKTRGRPGDAPREDAAAGPPHAGAGATGSHA